MSLEILDTTLRDGEQTSGVSFSESDKLTIAQLLLKELKVDRLEIASARVSTGEYNSAKHILDWGREDGRLGQIEILGFVDEGRSVDWINQVGGCVINLLTKGSLKHCTMQLKKSPEEHFGEIREVVEYAGSKGLEVNVYLEDWSNGMRESSGYVNGLIEGLRALDIKRIMLPDTLGVLNHRETATYCTEIIEKFPEVHFDFHAHNDYDLSVANVYEAVKAGVKGIHTTINGLGERAGNVPVSSVLAMLKDHLQIETNLDESKLYKISKLVESFSGVRIPQNKPLIGESVFTQTSGVHADGDSKDNLYQTILSPTRFGRSYDYALGKLSGKSNITKNLEALGIKLPAEDLRKVTDRIIELGDKKESITQEDLPFIVNDITGQTEEESIKVLDYSLSVGKELKSNATISVAIDGIVSEQTAAGDGQYDAFMNALTKIYKRFGRSLPRLLDYEVQIPPGGNTDALVIATITWEQNSNQFKTKGLDSDQTVAAIKATTKMLNVKEKKVLNGI